MLEHGGNLHQAVQRYQIPLEQWLDLSTGINPVSYPLPEIPVNLWQRLPLAEDGLVEAARQYYGVEHLLPTSGSQAAIQALPRLRPKCRVAMPHNMYSEHARHWQQQGHEVTLYQTLPSEALIQQVDVLVVCNPNNPTGLMLPASTLLEWHDQLSAKGGWLVVDEAFMDVTPEYSLAAYVGRSGLVILRSLGKFFGLAGARVGFALASPDVLLALQELLGPWPLSGPARLAARLALQDTRWQQAMRPRLKAASDRLHQVLHAHGLSPQGGTALFQWMVHEQAAAWQQHCASQGIWLRRFNTPQALRFGLPAVDDAQDDLHHSRSATPWLRLQQALASFPVSG